MTARKSRVLVVDDDPVTCELLRGFLDEKGYRVELAADGEEALEVVRADCPDLVILDLDLPGLSGLEVMRRLEADNIETKIIAVSGHPAADQLGPDGIKLGATQFITKPIDLEELELRLMAELEPSRVSNVSVLVVDDDPVTREILGGFLDEKGFRVQMAADGEQALQMLRDDVPDVMLLDIFLPGISGIDVLKRIAEEGHELSVISISGEHDEEAARETLELGAADFITKPLDLEYLEVSLLAKLIAVGL